ncbi:hypothetical protein GM418_18295 [Maribellus comscasis]|uniref:Uncharacterized protein n=1 Tax=Maribellus comscasis TaxID=2681766 RepID=A0A6I6JSX5_9BACT|nr:hypothetical protein [Maribellus comscasis]QGY45551.1 hypothetical protein GM418_18295 [Maribellus comscasis]
MNNNQKENTGNSEKNVKQTTFKNAVLETTIDQILAVLDTEVEVPEGLVDKVIKEKNSIKLSAGNRFDFSKYLQIAAVLIAAVLLGVLLGKNADVNSFQKKQSQQNKALLELKDKHHLSENYSFGRL